MRLLALAAVSCALVLAGGGCENILGLPDYTLCGPSGAGGCGGAGGSGGDGGTDAPG